MPKPRYRRVNPRELFDTLGIPVEIQDGSYSDDTQEWIEWAIRNYIAEYIQPLREQYQRVAT